MTNFHSDQGCLYLVPTPIAAVTTAQELTLTLPAHTLERAGEISIWLVENAKTARQFLKHVQAFRTTPKAIREMQIVEFLRAEPSEVTAILQMALQGEKVGLLSEAGMPCIADPGRLIVRQARALGLHVQALVGPNSILLALALSGLDGQRFAFHGYLPIESLARTKALQRLEQQSRQQNATQLFIETPYRNQALWASMLSAVIPATELLAAQGLTSGQQQVVCQRADQLRQTAWQPDAKVPCLFGLFAST